MSVVSDRSGPPATDTTAIGIGIRCQSTGVDEAGPQVARVRARRSPAADSSRPHRSVSMPTRSRTGPPSLPSQPVSPRLAAHQPSFSVGSSANSMDWVEEVVLELALDEPGVAVLEARRAPRPAPRCSGSSQSSSA